jgi:hypothetical protein
MDFPGPAQGGGDDYSTGYREGMRERARLQAALDQLQRAVASSLPSVVMTKDQAPCDSEP